MKKRFNTIPRISTRSYYSLTSGKKLKTSSYFLYPQSSFKKLNNKKEITIIIHGLRNDKSAALNKFVLGKNRLKKLGYTFPIVGYTYDSNTKGAHIKKTALRALRVGQLIAKQNGNNLCRFIIDFKKKNPKTKIRLIGHSLGTELIISTITKLSSRKNTQNIIESVHFFGSSVSSNFAHPKQHGKNIQKIVRTKIKNYYSPKDEVLAASNNDGTVNNPLGLTGSIGKTIQKYSQSKVFPKNHRFVSYMAVLKSFP